jgi:hypothetical protein
LRHEIMLLLFAGIWQTLPLQREHISYLWTKK